MEGLLDEKNPNERTPQLLPKQQIMQDDNDDDWKAPDFDGSEQCCICFGRVLLTFLCPVCCPCNLKVLNEFDRGVKLRLGKKTHRGTLKGGMHILVPCVDSLLQIDTRETLLDVPKQNVVTREGLSLKVDAVVYYKVFNASRALLGIQNVRNAVLLLAQTKLREALGVNTFEEIQSNRGVIASHLKESLDAATDPWGIDVTRVEITDLILPDSMMRAMGTEAEAKRVAKAKIIEAQGEMGAAETLRDASIIMAQSPGTMQLRFLQTLTQISAEKNSTIVLPFPSDLLNNIMHAGGSQNSGYHAVQQNAV